MVEDLIFQFLANFIKDGEIEEKLIYKNYMDGRYEGTKMDSKGENIYDKLNRKYLSKAREQGMTPSNYVMTYIIPNS